MKIKKNINVTNEQLRALEHNLERRYSGSTIIFGREGSWIVWGVLEVPRHLQRRGIGTAIAKNVIHFARQHGYGIKLSPGSEGDLDFTSSRADVIRFWKRLGFKMNSNGIMYLSKPKP